MTAIAYDESFGEAVTMRFSALAVSFEARPMMGGLCYTLAEKMCVGCLRIG